VGRLFCPQFTVHQFGGQKSVAHPTGYKASATDFNAAKPFSNWPPTIFSQFMIKPYSLAHELFFPYIVHVTVV